MTLQHQRVRYCQPLRLYHSVSVQQNVKINVSRAFVDRLGPTKLLLDRLGSIQKVQRVEVCLDLEGVSAV